MKSTPVMPSKLNLLTIVRFYYADERKADGFAAFRDVSGPFHAEHYLELAETKDQRPWLQTFVGGQGYKDFS